MKAEVVVIVIHVFSDENFIYITFEGNVEGACKLEILRFNA